MSSLDRHLRRLDDHGGLRFHPDCPVCQQRLAGTLPRDRLVSRQAQAGLVAGLLAVSALAPGASLAQPSHGAAQTTRTPAPPPPAAPPVDPTLDPDWQPPGPEGPAVPEPPEAAPPSSDDGQGGTVDEEVGPVESEPVQETIPEPQEIDAPPPAMPAPPTAPIEVPPAPVEETPTPVPAPPAETPAAPVQPATPPEEGELIERSQGQAVVGKERVIRIGLEPNPPATPASRVQAVAAPAPEQAADPAPASSPSAETVPVAREASAPQRKIDGRTYVVRPGDNLWSIARRLLDPGASPAKIAHEVNRLWELNKDRISTGDPDLLRVGTELQL